MSMSETSNGTGGGSIGGDSDSSSLSENTKICRDFMRNVCHRSNCRFIHPENGKIRTEPIFCHDYQIGKCFRTSCKFVHCSASDEDSFKRTGVLPPGVTDPENKGRTRNPVGGSPRNVGNRNNKSLSSGRGENARVESDNAPICKDFLKGMCDRGLRGCKYRHVPSRGRGIPATPAHSYGSPVMVRGRGGVRMMMAPVVAPTNNGNRRKAPRSELYDDHPHQSKRFRGGGMHEEEYYEEEEEDAEDYEIMDPMVPPPPPPLLPHNNQGGNQGQGYYQNPHQHGGNLGYVAMGHPHPTPPPPIHNRNGVVPVPHYNNQQNHTHHNQYNPHDPTVPYFQTPGAAAQADTIKSLEDENFMLKRRIEELKSSNEFLLSQNAQLRLNSTLTVGTSVAQVAPLSVSAVSVSAAGITSAQPSIIGITSSSLTGSQPLPTISISTLPTPISISQTTQPQIYLPAPPN